MIGNTSISLLRYSEIKDKRLCQNIRVFKNNAIEFQTYLCLFS